MQNTSEDDFKQKLTPAQYKVLRQRATEPPFSGEFVDFHVDGTFHCAACGQQLFNSSTKFESNSGWPSFYEALPGAVNFQDDSTLGMQRTEITCTNCGSHLGHIFAGEGYNTPTDKRFCVNSLSLQFTPKQETKG